MSKDVHSDRVSAHPPLLPAAAAATAATAARPRILWDLITIPLGIFDLPEFIDFLSIVARTGVFFWCVWRIDENLRESMRAEKWPPPSNPDFGLTPLS